MQITFLGTSSAVHSNERNHPSIAIKAFGETILFDCGEATQKQMISSNISPMKVSKIFITHYHGDHILGLPGLLQSMSLNGRETTLTIYGPKGLDKVKNAIYSLGYCAIEYPVEFIEIDSGIIEDNEEYFIQAERVRHNVPTLAYSIEEKKKPRFLREKAIELGVPVGPAFGRLHNGEEVEIDGKIIKPEQVLGEPRKGAKITYSGDTKPCEEMIMLARDSTLLIHESTFVEEDKLNAEEHAHSTSVDAAYVARESNSKKLILTHISSRYTKEYEEKMLNEAREVFENTELAYDLLEIEVK
ncbi:ribonuclease Z [Methanobrevibacter sp.]|uniref:ribonuclease Z n=1 Tax=Methanobrevibacter sp. TaxID=66852 RepID=UPI0025EB6AF6|nr:ribonuclease Z [Methanobrevibacter sp.]MBR4447535.1 ribonuclease Z [Methanobrevibacter sp.]